MLNSGQVYSLPFNNIFVLLNLVRCLLLWRVLQTTVLHFRLWITRVDILIPIKGCNIKS